MALMLSNRCRLLLGHGPLHARCAFVIGLSMALLAGCQQGPSSTADTSVLVSPCNRLRAIDLPAERLEDTAHRLARVSNCFIEAEQPQTSATRVAAVQGRLSIAAALSRAIAGTGLSLIQQGNTLTIHAGR